MDSKVKEECVHVFMFHPRGHHHALAEALTLHAPQDGRLAVLPMLRLEVPEKTRVAPQLHFRCTSLNQPHLDCALH